MPIGVKCTLNVAPYNKIFTAKRNQGAESRRILSKTIKLLSSHCIFRVKKYAKSKEVCIFGDRMTLS